MMLRVEGLSRRFGAAAALDGVSLSLQAGEFAALLGPSGSGKTTLLRILAGLEFADAGQVFIDGQDVARVPARERGVGVVFQHYALFRHMSVFENVAFGLRVRPRATRPANAEIDRRVRELLELVQIPELGRRYPDQISGGQRQRVALARALAIEPRLLLLDEPFGALDALVRKDVRRWVRGLHERLGLTSILVTHDQEEAMEMADRVAVMEQGRLVQFAPPAELLSAPATPFVAGFLGEAARVPGRVEDGRLVLDALGPVGAVPLADGAVEVFLRPHQIRVLAAAGDTSMAVAVHARPEASGGFRILAECQGRLFEGIGDTHQARGAALRLVVSGCTAFAADGRAHTLQLSQAARSDVLT